MTDESPDRLLSGNERKALYNRHRVAARSVRVLFALAFLVTGILLLPAAPLGGGWWRPAAWPWLFFAGALLIGQSALLMRRWSDSTAAAVVIVTSAARIVNLLIDPIPKVDSGLFTALAIVYWTTLLGFGVAWPWVMRPSTLSHRLIRYEGDHRDGTV